MSDAMDDEAFSGTCPTCGQAYLEAEIRRLQEQLGHGMPAIEELTKEREMYRMRWLGSVTPEDAALIRAENARLRAVLQSVIDAADEIHLTDGVTLLRMRQLAINAIALNDEQSQEPKS